MNYKNPVIAVKNLTKTFDLKSNKRNTIRELFTRIKSNKPDHNGKLKALININFEVNKGDFFGILGKNGSGKSTLLNILIGSIKPDANSKVVVNGKMIRLALGMGFDPNLSARDNIYINGSILGLTFKKIGSIFDDIVEFAEITNFIDIPVKTFSSGMLSKLKFSIAMHAKADIFLMDEFFGGVGDISFKEKSTKIFKNTFLDGRTIIHVSHQLATIRNHCNKVLVLDKGKQVGIGPPIEMIELYRNLSSND